MSMTLYLAVCLMLLLAPVVESGPQTENFFNPASEPFAVDEPRRWLDLRVDQELKRLQREIDVLSSGLMEVTFYGVQFTITKTAGTGSGVGASSSPYVVSALGQTLEGSTPFVTLALRLLNSGAIKPNRVMATGNRVSVQRGPLQPIYAPGYNYKELTLRFLRLVWVERKPADALKVFGGAFRQHYSSLESGSTAALQGYEQMLSMYPNMTVTFYRAVADGNVVGVHMHMKPNSTMAGWSSFELFRWQGQYIAEHWEITEGVPADQSAASFFNCAGCGCEMSANDIKGLTLDFLHTTLQLRDPATAVVQHCGACTEHSASITSGWVSYFQDLYNVHPNVHTTIEMVLVDGSFVMVLVMLGSGTQSWISGHVFRWSQSAIEEQWHVMQAV
eukprot:NODE_1914_length_1357_cov_28.819572_g1733_i0.p1 GENE.NODE_1914_length_1357_cov_28.819572_g1733_i0~~NODE_1914_length_1357_cov_28.819572_g1733_i0.p1  ORF type:complete len:389 (+),score=67.79 NODE_1914_length_1357_cov_28.819572_g1733_i0:68-1234(+)